MLSLTAFADELEREKARQRTYDAMLRKAKAGHVTGGRVFGYDNLDVPTPTGTRGHVERRINETEAAIVRRIFEVSAAGTGFTHIAKLLNTEKARCPRAQQGRPHGWAPTTIREVINRPLYRGEVVWNRTRKRDRWGIHKTATRPEHEWLRQHVPALQIVPDALWTSVHERLKGVRRQLAAATGNRPGVHARDIDSRHLLPGFARCNVCGGALGILTRNHGADKRVPFYGCTAYHKRGTSVCGNNLCVRAEAVEDAVLCALGGDVLRSPVVMAIVDGVIAELQPANMRQRLSRLRSEVADIDQALSRLADAVAAGGPLDSLVTAVSARQTRRDELVMAIAAAERAERHMFSRHAIAEKVRVKLEDWRGLIASDVQGGRRLLRETLVAQVHARGGDRIDLKEKSRSAACSLA